MSCLKRLFICGSTPQPNNNTEKPEITQIEKKIVVFEPVVCEEKCCDMSVCLSPAPWNHLVVDDSEINRLVMRKYLQRLGETFTEANSGNLALEKVKTDNFNMIWMDVKMPGISGIETSMKLRQNGFTGHIIGLTGQVEQEVVAECKEKGMNQVLAKPIVLKDIDQLIKVYKMKKT
jgi:CheY-like chemotaxis protein